MGKEFLDLTPKAWSIKLKIDKLDFIKIKYFLSAKDPGMFLSNNKRIKRHTTDWEKIFANHIICQRPTTWNIKNSQNSTVKKKIQLENEQKTFHWRGYTDGKQVDEKMFNILVTGRHKLKPQWSITTHLLEKLK